MKNLIIRFPKFQYFYRNILGIRNTLNCIIICNFKSPFHYIYCEWCLLECDCDKNTTKADCFHQLLSNIYTSVPLLTVLSRQRLWQQQEGRKQEESCQEAEMDVGTVNGAGQPEDTKQYYISALLFET